MKDDRYFLGDKAFYHCPNCKKKEDYSVYIDEARGKILHHCVGKCTSCGYEYTPDENIRDVG